MISVKGFTRALTAAWPRWAPTATIVAACLLSAAAGWNNFPTTDEPYHTLAGFSYVHDGHADLNPEHPPLAKLLSGVALLPLGLRGTTAPPVARLESAAEEINRFTYDNAAPPLTIMRVARLPQLVFLVALLAGIHRWARYAWGERAGLLAVLAVASQPLVLGHAFVLHTDVASAATWVWTLYCLHRWLDGRRHGWVGFGVAFGLALLAKFTSLYLLPLTVIALLAHQLRARSARRLIEYCAAGMLALAVVAGGYAVTLRNASVAEERAVIARTMSLWRGSGPTEAAIERLAAVSTPLAHYALGVAYVRFCDEEGRVNYFLGETSLAGFPLYFPTAFALKTTLPFFLLTAWGIFAFARRPHVIDGLVLLGALVYFFLSATSTYNIGARHLMPAIAMLAFVAAHRAADLSRFIRTVVVVSLIAGAVLPFPHYIAHFSALVGGARHGAGYLNDSNLDWEQDWVRLAARARSSGWEPLHLVYIGYGRPEYFAAGSIDWLASNGTVRPGVYAVSSFAADVGPEVLRAHGRPGAAGRLTDVVAALRRDATEVGNVGHTISVYRLGPASRSDDRR